MLLVLTAEKRVMFKICSKKLITGPIGNRLVASWEARHGKPSFFQEATPLFPQYDANVA